MLWVNTRKECDSHLSTSAVDVDPLGKKRLVSFMEQSSIDVMDMASFIKLPDWFSSMALRLGETWSVQRLCSPVVSQRVAMRAQVSFWYKANTLI